MAKRKTPPLPILRIKAGDSLTTIYAKAHRAFTAADLQKYTEIEEGVPARVVIAELEAAQRAYDAAKKKKKAKRDRSR